MIDLSVVIVSWNTSEMVMDCLGSLYASADSPACEIIVVDNASSDDSVSRMRERYPETRVICNNENVGFSRACNQGIRSSGGRHIMLLNSDTEVLPGALATLVDFLDEHPAAGAIGPQLLNADGSLQNSCHPLLTPEREFWRLMFLDRLVPWATYRMDRWDVESARRVEVIKGACLVLRRTTLDETGLLDERYFMYSEEMDLCLRIARAGWQLYWIPASRVVHYGAASTRQVAEPMYLQLYRSKLQFQKKFFGPWGAWRLKAAVALAYAPRWAVAKAGGHLDGSLARRAGTYGRLLSELPRM